MTKGGLPIVMMNLLLAVALFGSPAAGQGPPEAIPELRWVAAARALDEDAPDLLHPHTRELVNEQSEKFLAEFGSAARHGLREGRLAPEEFCTVKDIGAGVLIRGADNEGEFGSGLLLSEVAVVATVTGVVSGFGGSAWIETLLELGDVVPLHDRSPIPGYVLVPAQRVVAEDRVFCGGYGAEFDPVIGTRVVVIGPWVKGVVPVAPSLVTMLANVQKDGEALRWLVKGGSPAPGTLLDLQARVDEAVRGNLFSLTTDLVQLEEFAEHRSRFAVEWLRRADRGCRLIAVDEASGRRTEICIDPKAPAAAKARFERAWWQQCADGGTPPFAEVVSGTERSRLDICDR